MAISDLQPMPDLTTPDRDAASLHAELDEAERLVCDLAALLDAGLVVVSKQLGRPARYRVVAEPERRSRPRPPA